MRHAASFRLGMFTAVLQFLSNHSAAGQTAVPQWQHLLRPVSPGERSPGVLAARELADGTVMIVTDALVAYRYDHDGNALSAVALQAATFRPPSGPSPEPSSPGVASIGSPPNPWRAYAAIDAFGVVAVARLGNRESRDPLHLRGDIVTDRFDGLTGKSLWGTAVVFDTGVFVLEYPTGLFFDPIGDVLVTGIIGNGGMTHVTLKYRRADGSVAWGPQLISSVESIGTAALTSSGDLWVSVAQSGHGLTTLQYSGGAGSIQVGPISTVPPVFEKPESSAIDSDGNFIVVGESEHQPMAIKYSRFQAGVAWGPILYDAPDGDESFSSMGVDASGDILVSSRTENSQPFAVSVHKLDGTTGERIWRILADSSAALEPLPAVAVTGSGDVVLTSRSTEGPDSSLSFWRFRGADGAPVWGPVSLGTTVDEPFSPAPPFVSTIVSNGRVFAAGRFTEGPTVVSKVMELLGSTGGLAWGPSPIATLPIQGGTLQDLAGGPSGALAIVGNTHDGSVGTFKYSRAFGSRTWGPSVLPDASGVQSQIDAAGNVMIVAVRPVVGEIVLVKYAATDGATVWGPVSVGFGNVERMALDPSGNPVVVFWGAPPAGGSYDAAVVKVDGATGAVSWGPIFYDSGEGQDDFARTLAITPSGDVFLVGDTWPIGAPIHWFVLKYAGADGALLWGGGLTIDGTPFGAATDAAGNLAVTGSGGLSTAKFAGASGSLLWGPVSVPAEGFSEGRAMGIDTSGDVFVLGKVDQYMATARYAGSDGHLIWGPRLLDGQIHSLVIPYDLGLGFDAAGNVVVGGYSRTPSQAYDLVTIKYAAVSGSTLWGPLYVGSYDEERMTGFSVDGDSVVVGASSQDGLYFAGLDEKFGIGTLPPDPAPATCGVPYGFSFVAQNGTTPYSWTVSTGELPEGLLLSTTGILSGVPVGPGTYAFTVEAEDSASHAAARDFELIVSENSGGRIQAISHELCSVDLDVPGSWESYLWLPGGETTPTINVAPLETTTYGVIVSDGAGCTEHLGVVVPGTILQDPDCLGPVVTTISPGSGPASGTAVTLTGLNFQAGAAVTVGGSDAADVVVNDSGTITATTPALSPGTLYDVVVANPDGGNAALLSGFLADFSDVPDDNLFHDDVATLIRNAITAGCGGGNYCPADAATRAQMAVFLLKSRYGSGYVPPPAIGIFQDVPVDDPFAPWIERLHDLGVTVGCGGDNYCPAAAVTRAQMAVFLLKTRNGATYVPPGASGIFGDVPVSDSFAPWIENLYGYGITGGCNASPLLYCPASSVTRGQMAAFLVRTFNLQ